MSTSTRPPHTDLPAHAAPPPPPDDRRPDASPGPPVRPAARPIGWGLALIGAGALWLLDIAGVRIDWLLVLPIAITGIGLLLLAGGRHVARSGLIGLGITLAVIALVMSVVPLQLSVTAGDRTHTVTDVTDLDQSYSLGAGTLTLDLRDLELPTGTTEVEASVSLGELVVRVPADVTVTGTGHSIAGEVDGFGHTTGGIAPRHTFDEPGVEGGPVLELDLRAGLGRIEVTR